MNLYYKRVSGIILLVLFILSFSCAATESNLNEHWAYTAMNKLINENIISGDQFGNIRPEDSITRAEFVKVMNKAFSYSEKAAESFSDISSSEWYYDEFLIAKKVGYVSGDQNGKANPSAFITRAEACVVIKRILGLEEAKNSSSFIDINEIPNWALGSVLSLNEKGYINGYPDGSFKSNNLVTRAEAFYMLFKLPYRLQEKAVAENNLNATNVGGMPAVVTSKPSNSSGGGGGGSTNKTPDVDTPTISRYYEDTNTLVWKSVKNAASYEIKIVSGNYKEELTINAKSNQSEYSEDLTTQVNNISGKYDDAKITYQISIKANGKSGYNDSDYSTPIPFEKIYSALETPILSSRFGKANQLERAIISWNEVSGAKEYEVKLYVGNTESKSFQYDSENKELLIEDLSLLNTSSYVTVKAISNNKKEIKNSLIAKLDLVKPQAESRGKGTESDPIKIYTKEQFKEISSGIDKYYILMNNITLEDYTIIPEFKGSLTTFNNKYMTITLDLNSTASYTGLFGKLTGGRISNIITKGSVKGTSYTGGIAGYCPSGATIINCINMASISGTDSVGGITGNAINSNTITKCINYGSITGTKNVGGVCGFINGTNVDLCGNYGEVSGGTNTGGLIGAAYGSIYNSYNVGNIKKGNGGIAGIIQKPELTIKNCYNLGTITGTGSGIVDQYSTGGKVEDCYNAGSTTSPIVRKFLNDSNVAVVTASNCLYLSETLVSDGLSGTEPIKSEDLQKVDHDLVKELLTKDFEFAPGYIYPSIKGNHQISIDDIMTYEECSNLSSTYDGTNLTFNWTNPNRDDLDKILIRVQNNSRILNVLEETELENNQTQYTVSNVQSGCYYEIQLRIKYIDGTYSGSIKLEVLVP